ncbi:MAG: tetratricopeptide repeat protein [Terriglobales bacterium]
MKMDRSMTCSHWVPYVLPLWLLVLAPTSALASQASSEVTPEVQELYAEATTAEQHGDNATAIEKYRAMIKLAPNLAPAYNNLGILYFNLHDYTHAAEVLKRGLQLKPDMPTASAMLGVCYFQLGADEKAEPLLRAALRAKPTDDNVEMILVHILINLKKYEEAVVHLQDFLKRNPKDQQAWYMLGKSYLQLSEGALEKIDEIDPNSVVAHEIAGEIDESMHNYDLALVEYKKAVDIDPQLPGTHMHLANAYWLIGKWESAQTEFEAELKNDPNNCTAYWKIGNCMLEANDPSEDALSELNQAIERCPTLMQARVDRARALIRLGKHKDALPDLLMAEKDNPAEPTIHFLLASVYRAQGATSEAQQEMQTYSRLLRDARETVAGHANDANAIKDAAH